MSIEITLNYPKLSAADWRVLAAIKKLGGDSYRDDVAALASVSVKTASLSAGRLEAVGLLVNKRYYDRAEGKTRCYRTVTSAVQQGLDDVDNLGVTGENPDLPGGQCNQTVTLPAGQREETVTSLPVVNAVTEPDGAMLPIGNTMHVCMHDEEKIRDSLSFFDAPGLEKLLALPHLDLQLAEAWANCKLHRDLHGWGKIKRPVAYIYRQIEKGEYPVHQQELPEAVLDLTDQMADHPLAEMGARFVGGVWR